MFFANIILGPDPLEVANDNLIPTYSNSCSWTHLSCPIRCDLSTVAVQPQWIRPRCVGAAGESLNCAFPSKVAVVRGGQGVSALLIPPTLQRALGSLLRVRWKHSRGRTVAAAMEVTALQACHVRAAPQCTANHLGLRPCSNNNALSL